MALGQVAVREDVSAVEPFERVDCGFGVVGRPQAVRPVQRGRHASVEESSPARRLPA